MFRDHGGMGRNSAIWRDRGTSYRLGAVEIDWITPHRRVSAYKAMITETHTGDSEHPTTRPQIR
jgi:hypothetical protein